MAADRYTTWRSRRRKITKMVAQTENFVRVQVDGKVAHVVDIKPDGTRLESFDLEGGAH